jgi:hypothetical protein
LLVRARPDPEPARRRQAAEELGQWKTGVEEPKPLDASPAAITLAMICTPEHEEMDRKALALQLELEREQKASAMSTA